MINGKTKLIGLIGNPVSHSISPIIHNAALEELKLNWSYIPLPCETNNLSIVLDGLRKLDFQGLNITIPHKENIMKLCSDLCPLAQRIGAVNTLLPQETGGWKGTNTDVKGFISPLKKNNWQGKTALVMGCGGSARAVVAGLEELEFKKIIIMGRRELAVQNILNSLKNKNSKNSNLVGILTTDLNLIEAIKHSDLIVNTTPIGMRQENESLDPIEKKFPLGLEIWKHLESNTTLYDLIYTPLPTPWLAYGQKVGCPTIDGLEMLIQQGAASLSLWIQNENIPINSMRKAAIENLII